VGGKGAPVYAGAALVKGRAATRVMYTTQCSQQCGREAPLPKNASAAGLQGEGWVSSEQRRAPGSPTSRAVRWAQLM
jgi:hypothetical protein